MKRLLLILLIMTASSSASAAKLDDVSILSVNTDKGDIALKLHAASGPPDSYFTIDIVKSDADAFAKLAMVIKKLELGSRYKLGLDIKSFSMSPSGSTYRSTSATFFGSASGE